MGLGSNWHQIGDKTYYIPKVSKFYVEIKYLCDRHVNVYYTGKNIMQRGRMEMTLNFEGLEMQKWNIQTDRGQRVDQQIGLFV